MVMSGKVTEVSASTIADRSLGTVEAGTMIDLGERNLSEVKFKDGADTDIDANTYVLDSAFGTVILILHRLVTLSGQVKPEN